MIETVRRICADLASEAPTAKVVGERLGTIVDPGSDVTPLLVTPADRDFAEASIVREPGTDEPAYVALVPAEHAAPSVEDLRSTFGDYVAVPRIHWNTPRRIIFHPPTTGTTHTCAIVVDVRPGPGGVEDGTALVVTVRRDVRLDQ